MTDTLSPQTYFAAEQDERRFGSSVMERVRAHQSQLEASGDLEKMRLSYSVFYGDARDKKSAPSHKVLRSGKGGAVLKVNVNQYADIVRKQVTLITGQELSPQPKAKNSDSAQQATVSLAADLLEGYQSAGLAERLRQVVKDGTQYRAGYLLRCVDPTLGDEPETEDLTEDDLIVSEEGQLVGIRKEGDHVFFNLTPADVYYDWTAPKWDATDWHACRVWVNRFAEAARLEEAGALSGQPLDLEKKAKLLACQPDGLDRQTRFVSEATTSSGSKSDLVPLFYFLHKRNPAMPKGRKAVLLGDGTVLSDGPLEHPEYPLERYTPEEKTDTADGHAPAWDLLGLEEARNAALSIALTKESQSLPFIANIRKSGIAPSDLSIPYTVVDVNTKDDIPVAVSITSSGSESVAMAAALQGQQETISSINPVLRGNPQEAISGNGAASGYALIAEQAYVSISDPLARYKEVNRRTWRGIVSDYPVFFASKRRLRSVAGKARAGMVDKFEGAQLAAIEGVEVDAGNPATRGLSQRMALMEALQKSGAKIEPSRLVEMFQSGKWEPAVEDMQNEAGLIREENEAFAQGSEVLPAVKGENHLAHIRGHLPRTLADKSGPGLGKRLEHIQSHIDSLPPILPPEVVAELAMLGFMPPPPPPGMGPMGSMGPGGPGGPPPPSGPGGPKPEMPKLPPEGPQQPNLPNLPTLPSGEPATGAPQ